MHELAIAESIANVVSEHAEACKATRVTSVRLQVGEATNIVTDSLLFSFEMVISSMPALKGAQLLIDVIPHRARCRHCKQEFAVVGFIAQCPLCEKWDTDIISGTELRVLEMEIE